MARRVYATLQQYRDWSDNQDTVLTQRDLERASAVVSEATVGAVYDYDSTTLLPTDPVLVEALQAATLEVLDARAEDTAAGDLDGVEEATIGSVRFKLTPGTPVVPATGLPLEAHRVLLEAGLIRQPGDVVVYG